MVIIVDEQVNRKRALGILNELKSYGVNVEPAMQDMEQKSNWYNIFYAEGMTSPSITYARG